MRRSLADRVRAAFLELRRSERGIALPVAMMITIVSLGFAAVPIVASISSQHGDTRNQQANEALAAAEAGAELAVLRQSEWLTKEKAAAPACVSSGTLSAEGWCPQITGTVGEAEYKYILRPCYASTNPCTATKKTAACTTTSESNRPVQVVSTGLSSGASRRIELLACASVSAETNPEIVTKTKKREEVEKLLEEERKKGTATESSPGAPANIFSSGQIVGISWLNMNNDAQVYNGGTGSNGYVTMSGSANVCGSVKYGTTFTTDNSSSNAAPSGCSAGRTAAKGTASYPNITLPATISTNNSDARLAEADPVGPGVWQRGNISWNAANRFLTVSYDQLTLEGTAPYFLCRLVLAGGSKLLAGSGKSIKIYFDAPENCPGLNGSSQLQIANGAYVGPDSSNGPQFLFVGSPTENASFIELGGGANVSQFFVYAPRSKIVANNGVNLKGAIIGQTLELGGGAQINAGSAYTPPSTTEYLPPISETKPTESARKHEEEIKKLQEEIEKTQREKPTVESVTPLKQNRFVECTATGSGDSGC